MWCLYNPHSPLSGLSNNSLNGFSLKSKFLAVHISFGFGAHLCLGAPHARLIVRSLLKALTEKVAVIHIENEVPHIEITEAYQRSNGYDSLTARLSPKPPWDRGSSVRAAHSLGDEWSAPKPPLSRHR